MNQDHWTSPEHLSEKHMFIIHGWFAITGYVRRNLQMYPLSATGPVSTLRERSGNLGTSWPNPTTTCQWNRSSGERRCKCNRASSGTERRGTKPQQANATMTVDLNFSSIYLIYIMHCRWVSVLLCLLFKGVTLWCFADPFIVFFQV